MSEWIDMDHKKPPYGVIVNILYSTGLICSAIYLADGWILDKANAHIFNPTHWRKK